MKRKFSLVFIILCLVISCQKYDDTQIKKDISDLQEQVASLKAWCENSQAAIDAVDALKKAVEKFNGITYVESFSGSLGSGYHIGLDDGQEITIYNVKQEGSDTYLGNVIISQSSVVFTLSDGTSFSIPRKDGQIHFASYEAATVNLLDTMEVLLPEGFKKTDFAAFTAKVESGDGVATKAGNEDDDDWEVFTIAPKFDGQGNLVTNPMVVITGIPYESSSSVLSVSIVDNNGNRTGTSRVIYSGNTDKIYEILYHLVTTKFESSEIGEFIQWYSQAVYGYDDQFSLDPKIKAFISENREIIDILLRSDAQDPYVKSELELIARHPDEEMMIPGMNYSLDEDFYDDDTPDNSGSRNNWMGYGYKQMRNGLPNDRLVCHVSMPGSYYSLTRDMLKDIDLKKLVPWSEIPFFKKIMTFLGLSWLNKTMPDYAWNQFFRLKNQFRWGVRAFDFRLAEWGDQGLRGISPWTLRIDETLKIDEDIEIGGHKIHIDSLYLGDVGLPFAAYEKFEVELTELLNYMKKYPTEFCVFFLSTADYSPQTKQKIQNIIHNFKNKPEYSNMFLDFKKDLRVSEARGHVILIWKDDEVDVEMTGTPLWASVSDSDKQTKEAEIDKWNGKEWVKEADMWIQDVYDFGIAQAESSGESDKLRQAEARKKLDIMKKMTQEYSDAVMKNTPTPIWFENDATMQFYMYLPNWVRKKFFAKPYGNIQLSAHYFNKMAAREYLANYNRPAGMVFVNFAARSLTIWRAPGMARCYPYGDEMVDNIIQLNGRYKMPYEK